MQPAAFDGKFSAQMTFELIPDISDPFNTLATQSAVFYKEQANIMALAKDLAQVGFLKVIDSLRLSFDGDTKFAGYVEVWFRHEIASLLGAGNEKNVIGGILQVKSGDLLFEEEIKEGTFTTRIKAGFDQINNGYVSIKILSANGNGFEGRRVLCSAETQLTLMPKRVEFIEDDCELHVTGRAVLPSLVAVKIFETQLKALNFQEALKMANAAGNELVGYALTAVCLLCLYV